MKMTMKMKKGLSVLAVSAVVLVLVAMLFVGAGAAADVVLNPSADFAGGSGTADDPYLIETLDQMQNISNYYSGEKYYYWKVNPANKVFDCPLTYKAVNINGSFDGNGATFNNLQAQLFRSVGKAPSDETYTISNITINAHIIINGYGAAVIRQAGNNLVLDNITVHGYIEGNNGASSFVCFGPGNIAAPGSPEWQKLNWTFRNCYSDAQIVATGDLAVGFIKHPYCLGNDDVSLVTIEDSLFNGTLCNPDLTCCRYFIGNGASTGSTWADLNIKTTYSPEFLEKYGFSSPEEVDNRYSQVAITREGSVFKILNPGIDPNNYYPDQAGKKTALKSESGTLPEPYSTFTVCEIESGATYAKVELEICPNDKSGSGSYLGTYMTETVDLTGKSGSFTTDTIKYFHIDVNADGVTKQGLDENGVEYHVYDGGAFYGTTFNSATVRVIQYNDVGAVLKITTFGLSPNPPAAAVAIGDKVYPTLADAVNAAVSGDTLTMLKDVTLDTCVNISKTLTLDLNGKKIIPKSGGLTPSAAGSKNALFAVNYDGNLTIDDSSDLKTGNISYNGEPSVYAAIMLIEGGETKGSHANATLIVNAGTLNGLYYGIVGNGARHGTEVTINGGTISAHEGAGIYHPQIGILTINGGKITGATGIYVKSGSITVTQASDVTIEGTGASTPYVYIGSGFEPTGDAFVIDNCLSDRVAPDVAISGGTFISTNNRSVASYVKQDDPTCSTEKYDRVLQFVTGGQFDDDSVKNYTAPGYCALGPVSGYYTVIAGSEPKIDVEPTKDASGKTEIPTTSTPNTNVSVNKEDKSVVLKDNSTNVEVTYQYDNDMEISDGKVNGTVTSVTASYPNMYAPNEEETIKIPISLTLNLNSSLVGEIVLPKIDTEYNEFAASAVDNPVATITGLPNGQSLEQINNNITEITLTFKNVAAPASGYRYVVYHVTESKKEAIKYWNENEGGDLQFTSKNGFSSYVLASEAVSHYVSSSSSKQTGSTQILPEATLAPTPYPTVTPTPATPTVNPTANPTTQSTQSSPVPFFGILAGLGVAALVLKLRK